METESVTVSPKTILAQVITTPSIFFNFCLQVYVLNVYGFQDTFVMTFDFGYKILPDGLTLLVCQKQSDIHMHIKYVYYEKRVRIKYNIFL